MAANNPSTDLVRACASTSFRCAVVISDHTVAAGAPPRSDPAKSGEFCIHLVTVERVRDSTWAGCDVLPTSWTGPRPGHQSRQTAGWDGHDKPGHDGLSGGQAQPKCQPACAIHTVSIIGPGLRPGKQGSLSPAWASAGIAAPLRLAVTA